MDLPNIAQQQVEWEAWQQLIEQFCALTGFTRDEVNAAKSTPFFEAVRAWGEELAQLRAS